jgi:hypothetical protein
MNVQVEVSGLVDVVRKPMVRVCWPLTVGVLRDSVVVVPLPLTHQPAFALDVQLPVVPVQVAIAAVEPLSPTTRLQNQEFVGSIRGAFEV